MENQLSTGDFTANIKIKCQPNTKGGLRPIFTVHGEIIEWQLMLNDNGLDWKNAVSEINPLPGFPVITEEVIRFHPDDITPSINIHEQFEENYKEYHEKIKTSMES